MESSSTRFTYTRDEILLLKKNNQLANLPSHLFASDYLTSHGKFSPDKYVESMWKGERNRKANPRNEIPDILQNGSTLSPQRRGFSSGCRESVETETDPFALRRRALNTAANSNINMFAGSQTRSGKVDKRFTLNASVSSQNNNNMAWRKFPLFNNNGEGRDNRFDGHQKSNGFKRGNESHNEALPEWMDDGPESSTDMIPLRGFNESEPDLQSLSVVNSHSSEQRNPGAELLESLNEKRMKLPSSDVEFAAQFGILNVEEIEAKILSDQVYAPKASRLSRFFGYEEDILKREDSPKVPVDTNVLPAVARLLSGGTRSMGTGITEHSVSNKRVDDLLHTDIPSQSNQYAPNVEALMQKSKNNIDLVPTAVMLQRSNVKDDAVRQEYKAPAFNNPNSSPTNEMSEQMSYDPRLGSQSTSLFDQPQGVGMFSNLHYMPAIAQLGTHLFPIPNVLAMAMDDRQIREAYQCANLTLMTALQSRLNAQMQVNAALQHFRHDASLLIVHLGDARFEQQLAKFVEQQRSLDSNMSSKPSSVSMSRTSPVENKISDIEDAFRAVTLEAMKRDAPPSSSMNHLNQFTSCDSSNLMNNCQQHYEKLAILEKLPSSSRAMTVEELERQMFGN